jgi:hypothetical protein
VQTDGKAGVSRHRLCNQRRYLCPVVKLGARDLRDSSSIDLTRIGAATSSSRSVSPTTAHRASRDEGGCSPRSRIINKRPSSIVFPAGDPGLQTREFRRV